MSEFKDNKTNAAEEEKYKDVGIIPQSETMKKLDNFWYYNKWKILVALLLIATILICTLQMCEGSKIDTYVLYSGPYPMMNADVKNGMMSAFEAVMPYDLNEDGSKTVQIVHTYVLSEDQIESLQAETNEEGTRINYIDLNFNMDEIEQFDNLIITGDYSICLLDPSLYQRVKSSGGFVKLSELFDEVPECAIDECGIAFAETEFAKYFEVFNVLPPDTVLCLRTPSTFLGGNDKDSKPYKMSEDTFKAIVNYIPE